MLELVYIETLDDYGIYIEPSNKYSEVSLIFTNELVLIANKCFVKVDEAFRLLYDGYKGLGNGIETQLHYKYDNEGKNC